MNRVFWPAQGQGPMETNYAETQATFAAPRRGGSESKLMAKTKCTKEDVRRTVQGAIEGGATIRTVETWPDGRIRVTTATIHNAPSDEPKDLRGLL